MEAVLKDGMNWAGGYAFALSLLFFLPAILAILRAHPRRWSILILLFVLGWTGIGWLVALIWSMGAARR
ncbi:MAG: superinfection immunity protein [Alphaproteobacteria bacterium]|nr:superinfection immunity protein [Alphaproteobacteria bacterium]